MKRHKVNIQIDKQKFIWQSSELASLLHSLQEEDKLLGLHFSDNDLKIINHNDFFDINLLDIYNNTTIILDRNLLIAARNIYDNGFSSDRVDRLFLQILSYAKFTNSILDPTIALYEGGDSKFVSASEDLRKMRIVDNLPLDSVLQLLFGEIEIIPNKVFIGAKFVSQPFDNETLEENYNKHLNLFRRNYPYFLKSTILLRQKNLSTIEKLRAFVEWTQEIYISMNIPHLIVMHSLFYNGGILKKIQTDSKEKLLKNIENATWDATILSYLKEQCKNNNNRYYLLATNDLMLVEVMKYCFSPNSKIEKLYGKNIKEVNNLISYNNELCSNSEREKLVLERLSNVNQIIRDLEDEL